MTAELGLEIKLGHVLQVVAADILEFSETNPNDPFPNFEFEDIDELSDLGENLIHTQIQASFMTKQEQDLCRRAILTFLNSNNPKKQEIANQLLPLFG